MTTHSKKYAAFIAAYDAARESLNTYIRDNGGIIENGEATGLSDKAEKVLSEKNNFLEILKAYAESAESLIKRGAAIPLNDSQMYQYAELFKELAAMNDKTLLLKIEEYRDYKIQENTTYSDFKKAIREINKMYALGIKRGIIDPSDAGLLRNYESSQLFISVETAAKEYYSNKINKLRGDVGTTDKMNMIRKLSYK